jgi:hypothetical protein
MQRIRNHKRDTIANVSDLVRDQDGVRRSVCRKRGKKSALKLAQTFPLDVRTG